MTQKTHYELHRDYGHGFQKAFDCPSIEKAEEYARNERSREEQFFKIICVTTTTDELKQFSVPAYVPCLEEIAEDIIGYSDGSFGIEWGEDFERLSAEDKQTVHDMVYEQIADCNHCGWHWSVDNLEEVDGECYCWRCYEDVIEREEEEQDED